MLIVGSGPKTFGALKGQFWVKFSLQKITSFWGILECIWTMPSDFFTKINHTKIFVVVRIHQYKKTLYFKKVFEKLLKGTFQPLCYGT